ncbi:MAG: VOC family protein [Nannocystaceae bacterium]|nr:VOC family protein [Nannocystaceae bacterium]
MKTLALTPIALLAACSASQKPHSEPPVVAQVSAAEPVAEQPSTNHNTDVGAFSVSLTVKDLAASREFYEKLGFVVIAGDATQNWLILQNGDHAIGLFQGAFERNMITFNPGWGQHQETLTEFTDVREIQRSLVERGVEIQLKADESTEGPASIIVVDPDGNPILFDQHVPSPKG